MARGMKMAAQFEQVDNIYIIIAVFEARAKEVEDAIGVQALAELSNFHPENDMILANTTSIGMQPKVDKAPIANMAWRAVVTSWSLDEGVV